MYNLQQATRRLGRRLTGGSTPAYTLEQQIDPQAQLRLSMQERAVIAPAEVLCHSIRDDAHHQVYVHHSEEAILVTEGNQLDRMFIQKESYSQLQRSRMQYIHLSVLQVSILTRGYEQWRNGEANLLITRGLVGRLSNTPNVSFAYEK
ncbi:hypothetical protein ZIOFF_031791 [Zingiber officinale]|uniref:Uncharacterized protein n=1 Tax=Zingiber officinale TaxID=94328 RepID=A0A8J5L565_ZINOF|nr:hypothetical protein ZIOFF_031791 [Zingiber officinale]